LVLQNTSFAVKLMDPETLRQLFRAEAEKLKLELQQDNIRWRDVVRREYQEMQQQIFTIQRGSAISLQHLHVKLDQQVKNVNDRFAEMRTEIATIRATPPTTASSSVQTRLTLSTQASKRGQPEPDGEDYFSSGVEEWFEGWDEPAWARAYPASSLASQPATKMSSSAMSASASPFAIDPSEVPSLADGVSGEAPSALCAFEHPVQAQTAALTAENLSALVDVLPHNPRRCMLCKYTFKHTRQSSFHHHNIFSMHKLTHEQAQ
jgi:BMFP domain-containing protein YqiC